MYYLNRFIKRSHLCFIHFHTELYIKVRYCEIVAIQFTAYNQLRHLYTF